MCVFTLQGQAFLKWWGIVRIFRRPFLLWRLHHGSIDGLLLRRHRMRCLFLSFKAVFRGVFRNGQICIELFHNFHMSYILLVLLPFWSPSSYTVSVPTCSFFLVYCQLPPPINAPWALPSCKLEWSQFCFCKSVWTTQPTLLVPPGLLVSYCSVFQRGPLWGCFLAFPMESIPPTDCSDFPNIIVRSSFSASTLFSPVLVKTMHSVWILILNSPVLTYWLQVRLLSFC